jgi:hypothetical protein
MPQPVCPKCSSEYVKRVSRLGSEHLISLFYIYPFRCQPCGHRFRLLQWGVTYTKIEEDQRAGRKRKEWIDRQKAEAPIAYGRDPGYQCPQYDDCSEPLAVSLI